MIRITIFLLALMLSGRSYAQLFHPRDSARLKPVLQLGAGAYLGTHFLAPAQDALFIPGHESGVLVQAALNVSRNLRLSAGLRYVQKNGTIRYNTVMPNLFVTDAAGWQVPLLLSYTLIVKGKEVLSISAGASMNRLTCRTTYQEVVRSSAPFTTADSREISATSGIRTLSGLVAVSREFPLGPALALGIFGEVEFVSAHPTLNELANTQVVNHTDPNLASRSAKLGLYLLY